MAVAPSLLLNFPKVHKEQVRDDTAFTDALQVFLGHATHTVCAESDE